MLDVELAIRNYRCFGDEPSRIRISDGFTALIGVNNSGKSSLLRLPYELRGLFNLLSYGRSNGNFQNLILGHGYGSVWTSAGMAAGERIFRTGVDKPMTIDITVNESPNGPFIIGNQKAVCSIAYDKSGLNSLILKDERGAVIDVNKAPDAIMQSTPPLSSAAGELGRAMYVGPFRNAINIGTQDQYYDIEIGESFIRRFAEYKSGANAEHNEAIYEMLQEVKRIFGYQNLDINPAGDYRTLQLIVDGRSYRLAEQGAGLAHFILVLANVLVRRPSLLLIDEPELNLHASLQLDFLQTIGQYTEYGVVFATHSLGLARTAADRIFGLARPGGGGPAIARRYEDDRELVTLLGQLSFDKRPDLGFSKVLLVEGKTELRALAQLLRLYGKEHTVLMISLHGDEMIRGDVKLELSELLRIGGDVKYLIDSERDKEGAPLSNNRQAFVELCSELGIDGHVLERRALENYFTESAIQRAIGESAHAPGFFEKKGANQAWPKTQNWRITSEMNRADLGGTDLGVFLEGL